MQDGIKVKRKTYTKSNLLLLNNMSETLKHLCKQQLHWTKTIFARISTNSCLLILKITCCRKNRAAHKYFESPIFFHDLMLKIQTISKIKPICWALNHFLKSRSKIKGTKHVLYSWCPFVTLIKHVPCIAEFARKLGCSIFKLIK